MELLNLNRKYELNVLLRQKTMIDLNLEYKTRCSNKEISFSEFIEDLLLERLQMM
jgi:hypothetical protein